jgi:hypothetical protein
MPLKYQMAQTLSSTQCNYKWKNKSAPPKSTGILPSRPAVFFDLTNQFNKSLQIPFPKSSPSPPSSMNKGGPSTTNGLMAHGAPSSWRRASAKAAQHSHPLLPRSLSQTFSSHSTSNYVNEPPLAFKTVTQGMMV